MRQEGRERDDVRDAEADDKIADQLRALRHDIAAAQNDLDEVIEGTQERARRLEQFENKEGGP